MRLVRFLPPRLRNLAPEALTFGVIGVVNVGVYFAIYTPLMIIGAVKANVVATVVTTTMSYLANRHWTYKDRPRTAIRREYTLFFAFNLAGMVIQSVVVGAAKYGLGLSERHDKLALVFAAGVGIALATLFRFWSYRTFVFKAAPVVAEVDVPAEPAAQRVPEARHEPVDDDLVSAELELAADPEFGQLTASLEAELDAAGQDAVDAPAGASRAR